MKKLTIFVLIIVVMVGFISADFYVKQNAHTDAFNMMGQDQPAKDIPSEIWISKDRIATITGGTSIILDMKGKVVYHVNHSTKEFVKMSIPFKLENFMGEAGKSAKAMMGKTTVKVTAGSEKKKIGKWNCALYTAKVGLMGGMMEMTMKMWTTKDVPFDLKAMKEFTRHSMSLGGGGLGGEEMVKEFEKIDGYPILTDIVASVMGQDIKSNNKVVEITEKSAPAGIYSVPKGYKETKTLPAPKRGM